MNPVQSFVIIAKVLTLSLLIFACVMAWGHHRSRDFDPAYGQKLGAWMGIAIMTLFLMIFIEDLRRMPPE